MKDIVELGMYYEINKVLSLFGKWNYTTTFITTEEFFGTPYTFATPKHDGKFIANKQLWQWNNKNKEIKKIRTKS